MGAAPLRPDLPVGDWTALSACCPGPLGRPTSDMLSAWAEPWRGSRSPRDPGFMNPTVGLVNEILVSFLSTNIKLFLKIKHLTRTDYNLPWLYIYIHIYIYDSITIIISYIKVLVNQ